MPHLGCAHGGEGKGSARHRPFTSQCGSAPFVRSALPMARPMLFLWGAHGARPARLLSAQPMAKRLLAIRGGAGAWPPPLKAPHWLGLWAVRTQFCSARPVRAPKEGQCFAHGKALPKTCRPRARAGKGLRESLGLSPPKAKQSRMKGSREAPPFHKPLDAKGILRKRSPFAHRAMWQGLHRPRPCGGFNGRLARCDRRLEGGFPS